MTHLHLLGMYSENATPYHSDVLMLMLIAASLTVTKDSSQPSSLSAVKEIMKYGANINWNTISSKETPQKFHENGQA